jgi:ABC-type transport system substrate-binding protein
LREAIARSIDRAAIQKVLLQNFGESMGGLFPQWLSGYSFLFPVAADLERARQRKAELGSLPALRLGYDADDPLARQVAERVAVNARDAGLILQVAPLPDPQTGGANASPEIEILRRRIGGPSLRAAARDFNRWLPFLEGPLDQPEAIFAAEKRLVESFTVVAITCVPEIMGLGPRVKNWNATRWGDWRLDTVWLEAEKP